jgi:hypothetical protein
MAHWKHMLWLTLYISAGLVLAGMLSKVFNISTIVGKLGVTTTA